ncbi:TPM domain-containing protein, partial [Burkholderia pseudomallei]
MKGFLRAACFAVLTFLSIGGACRAEQPVPPLAARVTDETGTLTAAERATLEQSLKDFETRKGSQIAVLIVPTTQPETIEQYSIRVAEQWKLGRANVDDGALLIIAKNDRALRIEVGYGLEGVLTDATSRRIIDEPNVPSFRRGDFYGGGPARAAGPCSWGARTGDVARAQRRQQRPVRGHRQREPRILQLDLERLIGARIDARRGGREM